MAKELDGMISEGKCKECGVKLYYPDLCWIGRTLYCIPHSKVAWTAQRVVAKKKREARVAALKRDPQPPQISSGAHSMVARRVAGLRQAAFGPWETNPYTGQLDIEPGAISDYYDYLREKS